MIGVLCSHQSAQAGEYVLAAMRRSVSAALAAPVSRSALRSISPTAVVAVDVPPGWGADLIEWLRRRPGKLIVFGKLPPALAGFLQCDVAALPDGFADMCRSESAPSRESRESAAAVVYGARAGALGGQAWHRAFERFDFADEWNNLGFGAIRGDQSMWAVADATSAPEDVELAAVQVHGERRFSYAALWDVGHSSVLWFNRPVGPCDSFEWRLVENYLSAYRADVLPCHPVLSEIPWGFDAAITSRLDCDEDVESARPLWQAYRRMNVPFSLAVHTTNLTGAEHHGILRELVDDGGTILSHTATHAPNWGGSYEAALHEAAQSAERLKAVTSVDVRYAVSPFHQSPQYALRALADVGYDGCIGGIIRNDPEFVVARGGRIAGVPDGFVGHSQQCMLHGDCMLGAGDPLRIYKQAFDLAYETRTLFGYLDHPFSARYQYGWTDEPARIAAHETFVAHIRSRAANPLFMSESDALDFLRFRSLVDVVEEADGFRVNVRNGARVANDTIVPRAFGIEWRGESLAVTDGMLVQ